jgi:hypothetical protein
MLTSGMDVPTFVGLFGFGLMMFAIMMLVSVGLFKGMMIISNQLFRWFSKIAKKRGEAK